MLTQELLRYRCRKWAKDNGFFYNEVDDIFVKTAKGLEVDALQKDDSSDALVRYIKGSSLVVVEKRKTTLPNPYGNCCKCKTKEEIANVFMGKDTPDNCTPCKHTSKKSDNIPENININDDCISVETECDNTLDNCTPCNCTLKQNDVVADCEYTGDYDLQYADDGKVYKVRIGGEDEGLVDGLCKGYESARSSWSAKKWECLNSVDYLKACEITLGTYVKQSFKSINNAVSRLIKRKLFEKYPNLKNAFKFCEPYKGNGWHVHLIISFNDEIPADLYETVLGSWKNRIIPSEDSFKTDEYLVKIRTFTEKEQLVKVLDYLNPTSTKKRERLKYYPFKVRAMESYGDVQKKHKKVLSNVSETLGVTKIEYKSLRKEIEILRASTTVISGKKDVIVHNYQYYFEPDMVKLARLAYTLEPEKIKMNKDEKSKISEHFSLTVKDTDGIQFGRTMTEIDFNYDKQRAIDLANFYEKMPCWKGYTVIRNNF